MMLRQMPEYPAVWDYPLVPIAELRRQCQIALGWRVDPGYLNAMHYWQRGLCGVCGQAWTRLLLDHDHQTGLIRGYLCESCNVGEGVGWGGAWHDWRMAPSARLIPGFPEMVYG